MTWLFALVFILVSLIYWIWWKRNMEPPDKTLFYPVWVSKTGRVSLRWGKPCDRPSEAQRVGKAEVDAGNASVSFVVRFGDGQKTPMADYTYPEAARKIVCHWESLWDATDPRA